MRSRHDGNSACFRVGRSPGTAALSALHLAASKRVAHHSPQPAGHCDRVSPNPDNAHAVEVAGLSRLSCLNHHSLPVGRAISVCRRKRRQIAICGRFPGPVRCVCCCGGRIRTVWSYVLLGSVYLALPIVSLCLTSMPTSDCPYWRSRWSSPAHRPHLLTVMQRISLRIHRNHQHPAASAAPVGCPP